MSYQNFYLITEGNMDSLFLKTVLPTNISDNIRIISGDGESSAISLARSRYIDGKNKVLLLLNAETIDKNVAASQKKQVENMIYSLSSNSNAKVIVFVPEIEQLLMVDKSFIERYFGRTLNDFEFDLIQNDPKYGLLKLTKDNSKSITKICTEILTQADENLIKKMQKHPQIQEIIDFFN